MDQDVCVYVYVCVCMSYCMCMCGVYSSEHVRVCVAVFNLGILTSLWRRCHSTLESLHRLRTHVCVHIHTYMCTYCSQQQKCRPCCDHEFYNSCSRHLSCSPIGNDIFDHQQNLSLPLLLPPLSPLLLETISCC